ncbi:MAG: DUF3014 domain-containing protein [Betaproteobacteria bacterium]|nr:DUF3014 domain-containing protein [Betaproteobacteria bacterium]
MTPSANDRRPLPAPPRNSRAWLWIVLGVAVLAAGAYYYFVLRQPTPAPEPAPPPPSPVVAPAAAPAPPAIQYPIENAQQGAEPPPRPALTLDQSDTVARDALAGLMGLPRFTQFFFGDDIIRRIVATVDNLPRERASRLMMPVKPVPGPFETTGTGDSRVIAAANAARYTPYVQLFDSLDSRKLVAAYVRLYPLFQQAYRELGYPTGYFNDRLVQAIDNALAAPSVTGPIAVTQPKVLYAFADPQLESLSAGQKTLLRMGPDNAAKVKAKLRELRAALTGNTPPKP